MNLLKRRTCLGMSLFVFFSTASFWAFLVTRYHYRTFRYSLGTYDAQRRQWTMVENGSDFDIPFHPFDEGQPKSLVILAYQRTGSTFFGHLFATNPDAFYVYEPLDSLYSSLYGTLQGWNVPTDIRIHKNGTERILPKIEVEMASNLLKSLLSCNVSNLPTELLVHRYFQTMPEEFPTMQRYIKCIADGKHKALISRFMSSVPSSYCGGRFGEVSDDRMEECRRLLTNGLNRENDNHTRIALFRNYIRLLSEARHLVNEHCVSSLLNSCQVSPLRVVKVVRGAMDSMEPLLRELPNFRVIHLIRDPRAVVLSRKNFDSSVGLHADAKNSDSMPLEALSYCRTVVRDFNARKELETRHPGKIYTIIYDHLVEHFPLYASNVYRFMDHAIPNATSGWIDETMGSKRKSSTIARNWQRVLSFREHHAIWQNCKEFFELIQYNWPR